MKYEARSEAERHYLGYSPSYYKGDTQIQWLKQFRSIISLSHNRTVR